MEVATDDLGVVFGLTDDVDVPLVDAGSDVNVVADLCVVDDLRVTVVVLVAFDGIIVVTFGLAASFDFAVLGAADDSLGLTATVVALIVAPTLGDLRPNDGLRVTGFILVATILDFGADSVVALTGDALDVVVNAGLMGEITTFGVMEVNWLSVAPVITIDGLAVLDDGLGFNVDFNVGTIAVDVLLGTVFNVVVVPECEIVAVGFGLVRGFGAAAFGAGFGAIDFAV